MEKSSEDEAFRRSCILPLAHMPKRFLVREFEIPDLSYSQSQLVAHIVSYLYNAIHEWVY